MSCKLYGPVSRWQRKHLGITAQQIADVLGVDIAEIEAYENGGLEPGLISAAYKMGLDMALKKELGSAG